MNEVEECNVLAVIAAALVLEKLKNEKDESIMLVTRRVKNRSGHDAVLRNVPVHSVEVQSMYLRRGVWLRWQRTMNEAEVMKGVLPTIPLIVKQNRKMKERATSSTRLKN